jgi:hypothetical protein
MTSPNELFSNLEVSGRPFAAVMQHCDFASGVLLFAAFLVASAGRVAPGARREWAAMLIFAIGGAVGGLYPEVCADGISARCRSQEWRFQLAASQYIHIAAGIVEFAAITIALLLAFRRTRGGLSRPTSLSWPTRPPWPARLSRPARLYQALLAGAVIGYPLLGAAYLVNVWGGVLEAVFFAGFTVMVATQLAERTAAPGEAPAASEPAAVSERD